MRVAGCAWLPDGGRAGLLWAGWVAWLWLLCVDVDMVGVSRGGCLVGGLYMGVVQDCGCWGFGRLAGRVHGCDVAPARLADWLTG